MHTEASLHMQDLDDDTHSVVSPSRQTTSSVSGLCNGAAEYRDDNVNGSAAGSDSLSGVMPAVQQTMREGVDEYDALLNRIVKQIEDSGPAGFVGFTACHRRSGVSTISANVAIRAADRNSGSVLLVEANLAHPRQRNLFGLIEKPGLFEVLGSAAVLDEAVASTRIPNLSLLGAGAYKINVPPAIAQSALEGFLQELRERFWLVIFDLPSDLSLSHWTPLVRQLDSLLLVIACEETTQRDLHRIQNQCALDDIRLAGSILNRHQSYVPGFLRR